MNNNIPVIFVHTGNQDYLKCAIESASKYGNSVHLLGNQTNRYMSSNWYNIEKLHSELFDQFKKRYIHMSTNTYEFELMCFKRYFLVYEYVKIINADRFIMLDSDILTYVNYGEVLPLSEEDCACSWLGDQSNYKWAACPCVFASTHAALKDFLEFLLNAYVDKNILKKLKEKNDNHKLKNIPGGICDMTLLYLWIEQVINSNKYKVRNTSIIRNDSVFDHNIQSSDGYEKSEFLYDQILRMKKIIYKDNKPFFVCKDGKHIRAYTLHFLGGAKTTMKAFYEEKGRFNKICNRYKIRLLSSPKWSNRGIIKLIKEKERK